MTTTRPPIARNWIGMQVGDTKIIRTLDCYQVQSQVGKVRKKHPECSDWRWSTRSLPDGSIEVRRVR
jgi:hypothetical protein